MSGPLPPPLPPRLPPRSTPPPLPAGGARPPQGPDAIKAGYVAAARELVERNHAGADGEGIFNAVMFTLVVLAAVGSSVLAYSR